MLNSETVTYTPVTTTASGLRGETSTPGTPVTLTALVAIGDTREQFGDNAPDLTVSYTLYFLPGNMPAATSSGFFTVRGERCEVSSGPNGRWGSMGEVVAVSRSGSRITPAVEPESPFRTLALGEDIEFVEPDLAYLLNPASGLYVEDPEAGTKAFVILPLVDGTAYEFVFAGDTLAGPQFASLLVVVSNDESVLPLNDAPVGGVAPASIGGEGDPIDSDVSATIAAYGAAGIVVESVGVGAFFEPGHDPFSVVAT